MEVSVLNEQDDLALNLDFVAQVVKQVIQDEGQTCDEVEVHFVTKTRIAELHQEYFNDPTPTDCISLPLDGPEVTHFRHLGIVFVCPKIAIEYCKEKGGDPFLEARLYLIHALLHLMGYDDQTENDRLKMRAAEKRHIEKI